MEEQLDNTTALAKLLHGASAEHLRSRGIERYELPTEGDDIADHMAPWDELDEGVRVIWLGYAAIVARRLAEHPEIVALLP